MSKQLLTIGGQQFALQFDYGCFRRLGMMWSMPGIQSVINRIVEIGMELEKGGDPTFENVERLGQVLLAAIQSASPEAIISLDAICNMIVTDSAQLTAAMEAVTQSINNPDDVGKQRPAK